MATRRMSVARRLKTRSRVCPNCALVVDKPVKCCPRCNTAMAKDRESNVTDKTSADSFPASDPPPYK